MEEQQKSLTRTGERIEDLAKRATGLENGEDINVRLDLLGELSSAIDSNEGAEALLSLSSRLDALTDPELMACETIDHIESASADGSCSDHNDWMPRVSCPPGKFVRSIGVVAQQVPAGWRCAFQAKCCSNVGIPLQHAEGRTLEGTGT